MAENTPTAPNVDMVGDLIKAATEPLIARIEALEAKVKSYETAEAVKSEGFVLPGSEEEQKAGEEAKKTRKKRLAEAEKRELEEQKAKE